MADEAPAQRGPGGPTGGVLRRPIKCHVTATKRKTCIVNKSSAVEQMGNRLATIDMGRKLGGVPFFRGGAELAPHLTQCGRSRGLPPCQVSSWSIQPLAKIHQHHRQTDKPVGLYGPIAPQVPNANSSECLQFEMPAELRSLHAGAAAAAADLDHYGRGQTRSE